MRWLLATNAFSTATVLFCIGPAKSGGGWLLKAFEAADQAAFAKSGSVLRPALAQDGGFLVCPFLSVLLTHSSLGEKRHDLLLLDVWLPHK